jgi:hypothetical protein
MRVRILDRTMTMKKCACPPCDNTAGDEDTTVCFDCEEAECLRIDDHLECQAEAQHRDRILEHGQQVTHTDRDYQRDPELRKLREP